MTKDCPKNGVLDAPSRHGRPERSTKTLSFQMSTQKKRIKFYLNEEDEKRASELLQAFVPRIAFVDGQRWQEPEPPLALNIQSAKSSEVYLWDRSVVETLPCAPLEKPYGVYTHQGPTSGLVVQMSRSLMKDGLLTMGQLTVGFDDESLAPTFDTIFKCFRKLGMQKLSCMAPDGTCLNRGIGGYIVGEAAQKFCRAGGRLEASAHNYFVIDG